MRLVTFKPPRALAHARVGAMLDDDLIVDLAAATWLRLVAEGALEKAARRIADALIPADMTDFLETGPVGLLAAAKALSWVNQARQDEVVLARADVRLFAPVPRPPTFRDGNFFEGHTRNAAAQLGGEISPNWYEIPAYYKGTPASIGGPDDPLRWPEPTEHLDYEFEYALVIGRAGRDIAPADIWSHVGGVMLLNDFSARDQQAREMPLLMGPTKGKDFDGGTVVGPYLVTPDEIGDIEALQIIGRVNGEVVCEARAGDAYWKWPDVISHISRGETLLPGDIIASGTVPGGSRFEQGGPSLQPGDVVEMEGTGLGALRTEIFRDADRAVR